MSTRRLLDDAESLAEEGLNDRSDENVIPPSLEGERAARQVGVDDLDRFFERLYQYYLDRGYATTITARIVNLLTLLFLASFSAFLLLFVNYTRLLQCGRRRHEEPCDLISEVVITHPLREYSLAECMPAIVYVSMLMLYWLWTLVHFILDWRMLSTMRAFCSTKLGMGEKEMSTAPWSQIVNHLVFLQSTTRLGMSREQTTHDIVGRIMRRENFLIGMINKDVIDFKINLPFLRHKVWFTKAVELNIYWCILNPMLDEHKRIRHELLSERRLVRRFRLAALINLAISPFVALSLLIHFFISNAESFYRHPTSLNARDWSRYAHWKMRELNELPHYLHNRLALSYRHALDYVTQFPSPQLALLAKLASFVLGALAALLIFLALIDERLLDSEILGRNLFWYSFLFGTALAIARSLLPLEGTVFAPEERMKEVSRFTHYMPKEWRRRCHTDSVKGQFESMFRLKALLFFDELVSVCFLPLLLFTSFPKSAKSIVTFLRRFTVHVEGHGDVCSLSTFDFSQHGNSKYLAPKQAAEKAMQSKQGKLEKSFVNFCSTYPEWPYGEDGRQLVEAVANLNEGAGRGENSNNLNSNTNANETQSIGSDDLRQAFESFLGSHLAPSMAGAHVSTPAVRRTSGGRSSGGSTSQVELRERRPSS